MLRSVPGRRRASGTRPGSCSISNSPAVPFLSSLSFSLDSLLEMPVLPFSRCARPGALQGQPHHPSKSFLLGPTKLSSLHGICPQQKPCPICLFFSAALGTSEKTQMSDELNTSLSARPGWAGLRVSAGSGSCCYLLLLHPLAALSLPFQPKSLLLQHRSGLGTPAPSLNKRLPAKFHTHLKRLGGKSLSLCDQQCHLSHVPAAVGSPRGGGIWAAQQHRQGSIPLLLLSRAPELQGAEHSALGLPQTPLQWRLDGKLIPTAPFLHLPYFKELQQLSKQYSNIKLLQLDVVCESSIKKVVKEVEEIVGDKGLNCLINNAGINVLASLEEVTAETMLTIYETNTVAQLMVTKAFLPLLRKAAQLGTGMGCHRAAIINMSSLAASMQLVQANEMFLKVYPYRIAKTALNMITRCLAADLKSDGILCISLHPGWLQTDMGGNMAPMQVQEAIPGILSVLDRLGEKENGSFLDWQGETLPW